MGPRAGKCHYGIKSQRKSLELRPFQGKNEYQNIEFEFLAISSYFPKIIE